MRHQILNILGMFDNHILWSIAKPIICEGELYGAAAGKTYAPHQSIRYRSLPLMLIFIASRRITVIMPPGEAVLNVLAKTSASNRSTVSVNSFYL